jgi:hypothetical protein
MKKLFWTYIGVMTVGALILSPNPVQALKFSLGAVYTGGTPSGIPPWLIVEIVEFEDVTDGVKLTLTAELKDSDEFIGAFYGNLDPIPENFDLKYFSGPQPSFINVPTSTSRNDYKAPGDGLFDFKIEWDAKQFDNEDEAAFTISGTDLDAADFNALSQPKNEANILSLFAVAHVQGIAGDPDSGHITVPDASVMLLLGSALIGLYVVGRKKAKRA